MNIILYQSKKANGNLEKELRSSFPQILEYTSMAPFCTQLRHMPAHGMIAVLAAADEKELTSLMSIRHLIADTPTILLLADKGTAVLAKAHKLYPRFIGDLEYGAREVVTVIRKLLGRKEIPLETELP
jgi:hypothetical protein